MRRGRGAGVTGALLWWVVSCGGGGHQPSDLAPAPATSADSVETFLFLIGDAGAPDPGFEPVLTALTREAGRHPDKSLVVFLGDNIYPRGMPDSAHRDRARAERRLSGQLDAVGAAGAQAIFVPGNHDWDHSGADGWNAIRRQQRFIAQHGGNAARLLPEDGCPGPTVIDVGRWLRLVALDTQWWLHDAAKPVEPSPCGVDRPGEVTDSLRVVLATRGGRHAVAVAHHPLESGGPHGGHFPWTVHVFPLRRLHPWLWIPLPIIGSAYPVARKLGIATQDLPSGAYGTLRDSLRAAFQSGPPLAFAAGHDHNLQVIEDAAAGYVIVSGSGIFGHTNPVARIEGTRYASDESGFMRMDLLIDGRVRLAVIAVAADGTARETYAAWLR